MEIDQGRVEQIGSGAASRRGKDAAAPAAADAVVHERSLVLEDCLRPGFIILALLYLILGLGYSRLPAPGDIVLASIAWATALFLVGLFWVLGRRRRWRRHVNLVAGVVAVLILLNTLLHLIITRDPLQTINLMLLLIGAAFLLSSTGWLIGLILATQAGWWVIAVPFLRDPAWLRFGLALIAASALTFLIHLARTRSYAHVANLRRVAQTQALETEVRARQLETLIELSHEMNRSLDMEELLHRVVRAIRSRLNYDRVAVFLLDEGGRVLTLRAATGPAGKALVKRGYRIPLNEKSFIGRSMQGQEPAVMDFSLDLAKREAAALGDGLEDDSLEAPAERNISSGAVSSTVRRLPRMASEMALPLEGGGSLLGLLLVQTEEPDAFDETDARLCLSVASQLAVAIQNASRYELERSRRLLTEHLYAVSRALSQTLEASEVLALILDSLAEIVPFDRASVLLARGDVLEIVAARGFPPESQPSEMRISITEDDVFLRICQIKAPLVLPQIRESDNWQYVEALPPAQSWVGLPLVNAEDEVIGMLSLTRETRKPYTEDEVALGTAFAGQAGVALQNARLYMRLSHAYEQLERLDRAKSDFISLASHELRTPLTVMMGYTHMLLREPLALEDPGTKMMIEGLEVGVNRLQEVVDRMVDLAEIESQNLQLHCLSISLYELLEEVSWSFADALEQRHLTLHLDDFSELPEVEADHVSLYKVFHHLLMNAIKYTPDGGEIRVSATDVVAELHGRRVEAIDVLVEDTGIGIDPGDQEEVFGKFFQTGEVTLHSSGNIKFKGGGAGLGLAIVKGIVEAHGGEVWVESPGYDAQACPGSCFHVVLPLRQSVMGMGDVGRRTGDGSP